MTFPIVLHRYGFKVTLAIGIFGWVVRNALFATGGCQSSASSVCRCTDVSRSSSWSVRTFVM